MAVVSLVSAGEPTLALPNVALTLQLFDDEHPGVNEDKDCQADRPLDREQDQIDPTQQ